MSNTYTHSSQHPGPGYPPGPGAPVSGYPGQQQPGAGPRFPGYQPRGGAPQQNMRQPHYFQMNPQQATMMPQGQVYTFPQQGAVSMSYHIVGPTQQYQHTAAPAPGQQRPAQVMNNAAAPFQPGGQYPGGPQQVGVAGPYGGGPHLGGQNIIYSHGGAPGGGQVGHPGQVQMGMYGQPRYMMPHGQHMQPGHHLAMQQVPLSQAPPQGPLGPHQGAPPSHQQHSQQQQQQQQQQQPQQPVPSMYQHQPPQHPVASISTSGPPPSTTPQPVQQSSVYQPPQQQQQQPQQQQQQAAQQAPLQQQQPPQQQAPSQPPPAAAAPSSTLTRRPRNRIAIVDPSTGQEVKLDNTSTSKTPAVPAETPAAPSEPSSTSSTPAPSETSASSTAATAASEPKSGGKPSGIATEFAAKVAALAEGSVKKEDSPASSKRDSATPETASPEQSPAPEPVTVVKEGSEPAPTPEVAKTAEAEETTPETAAASSVSSLSVTTDLAREDCLYEPVSPTPLPDSPSDDTTKQVTAAAEASTKAASKPSPFQEVINKKAAAGTTPEADHEEEPFEHSKSGKKKKPSAAEKKRALNSKGEKKGDLLDVITSIQDKSDDAVVNDVADAVEKMSITQPAEAAESNDVAGNQAAEAPAHSEESPDSAPKVNGVSSSEARPDGDSEMEDGEIIDDEEDSDLKIKLKYEYESDQWSPLNPDGKKQYGREFLICLQRDPLSLQKPTNLPNMEIVKDKPNLNQKTQSRFDFTPNFVKGSNSRGPPGRGRGSQGGDRKGRGGDRVDGGKPRMVINLPSISQEVKLNKAENAWVPSAMNKKKDSSAAPEGAENEFADLRKKSLAILNKLTPQKFETLVTKFQDLPIDSSEKLSLCMELVFEKAVDEPSFSVAYAQMCAELQKKKVQDETGKEVNFRKLLIMRCQQEFEKDYMEGLDREKYVEQMNSTTDEEEKKRIKGEFEAMEMKARKRSLGNIRFIGELYKLGMLTARIMHECVRKLLISNPNDEESLECLCRLLTTVGQALDRETSERLSKGAVQGLADMGNYFKEMNKLVSERKTSARVRFLMQDVIDLRNNGWKKRREDAGPKTIDQIHKEVEKEQMEQKLAHMTSSMGPPPARRDNDRRNYDRNDDRRRSTKGGPPGGGQQDGGDGWTNVPTRAARFQPEKIDASRIRNMQSNKADADSMSFGPPKGGPAGAFGSWGRGSQSGKSSRAEQPAANTNRFSQLDQAEGGGGAGHYEGRGSDGRRADRYGGRSSRDISMDSGRANALQSARDAMNPRSQSVMGPHPALSRENSGPKEPGRSQSMVHTNSSFADASLLKGSDADQEQVEKWTKPLLEEFIHLGNFEETIKEISEKFNTKTISMFLEAVFNEVIERTNQARSKTGSLMSQLLLKKMISEDQFLDGLGVILDIAEDLLVDIPKLWDFLAQIVAPVLSSQAANMKILKSSSANLLSGDLGKTSAAGKYCAAILQEMGRSDQSQVSSLWAASGLQWTDFLQEAAVDQFIADHKLEWTMQASDAGEMTSERIERELRTLLKSNKDNEAVCSWIAGHCEDKVGSPTFIRLVTTVVVESCIDGIGGPTANCQLKQEQLIERRSILKKYILNEQDALQALLAIQNMVHRLEHPNKLLHSIFELLYNEDVITEEAFCNWETNKDPAEQEGKGVALKSCTQFLIYIKEAEEDDGE